MWGLIRRLTESVEEEPPYGPNTCRSFKIDIDCDLLFSFEDRTGGGEAGLEIYCQDVRSVTIDMDGKRYSVKCEDITVVIKYLESKTTKFYPRENVVEFEGYVFNVLQPKPTSIWLGCRGKIQMESDGGARISVEAEGEMFVSTKWVGLGRGNHYWIEIEPRSKK